MKIIQNKIQEYNIFCQKYSTDIEYDTILKYVNKLTFYLENKLQNLNSTIDSQKILDKHFKDACNYADNGVTFDMHRRAIELLNKFWIYGNLIAKYK